jgi:tape measure domain-containing protein
MAMTLGDIVVNIKSDTSELTKGFKRAESAVTKTAKTMNNAIKILTAGFISLSVVDLAKSLGRQADAMVNVDSKLKLVTKSTKELTNARKELFDISQKSRVSFIDTVDLYSRIARSTKNLNITQKELLSVTDTISKTLIISGGSAESMNAALVQLGQGFASGTLRGQELNSVMEQTPRLAEAIAEGMGITLGQLRAFAAEGKITSEAIISALKNQADSVGLEFSKMTKTIDQSQTQLSNSTTKIIGEFDKLTGVSSFVAESISDISKSIDGISKEDMQEFANLAQTIALIGTSMIAAKVGLAAYASVSKAVIASNIVMSGTFGAVNRSIIITTISTKALSFAMKTIPFIALATTVGLLADAWLNASKAQSKYNDTLAKTSEIDPIAENRARVAQLENMIESGKFNTVVVENWQRALIKLNAEYDKLTGVKREDFSEFDSDLLSFEEDIGFMIAENNALYKERKELALESINETIEPMQSILDMQIELAESGMNWSDSLTGVSGDIANIGKALTKIDVGKLKFEKADIKLQKDYAKNYLKVSGDIGKEKELAQQFDKDQAKLRQTQSDAEIGAYAHLAGAMSSAFEQGSAGAIAMTAVQSVLGIASSWTAIANAWALPFPANIPAAAMVASQVMPIIGQLGGGGGGGAGGSSNGGRLDFDQERENIDFTFDPIIDELERQTALLESIDLQGSAGSLNVDLARGTYERAYKDWAVDSLDVSASSFATGYTSGYSELSGVADAVNKATGLDVWGTEIWGRGEAKRLNQTLLLQKDNLLQVLLAMKEIGSDAFFGISDLGDLGIQTSLKQTSAIGFNNIFNDLQNVINDWALDVIDIIGAMSDSGDDFKRFFDNITGDMHFENMRLQEAYEDVNELRGEQSFGEFLKSEIENIPKLTEFLTPETLELLRGTDPTLINEQIAKIQELSDITKLSFDEGAEGALNYLESIELVSEAMTSSRENINAWEDSFKDSSELLSEMAVSLGIGIATTESELMSLFNSLKGGLGGLTDAELDFLESNKSFIDDFESAMLGITDSIDKAILSLRGNILAPDDFTASQDASIVQYWNKREEIDMLASQSATLTQSQQDELSGLVVEINKLSLDIQSQDIGDNTDISNQLISELGNLRDRLDFEDQILNVNIVGIQTNLSGLASNNINYNIDESTVPVYTNDGSLALSNNSDIISVLNVINARLENIEESSESASSDLEAMYNAGITIDGVVQTQEVSS